VAPLFFAEVGVTDLAPRRSYAALQGIAASSGEWSRADGRTTVLVDRGYNSKSVIRGWARRADGVDAGHGHRHRSAIDSVAGVVLFVAAFFCWSIWGAVYALLARLVRPEELGTAFGFSKQHQLHPAPIVGPTATGWVARPSPARSAPACVLAAILALAGVALAFAVREPPSLTPPPRPRPRSGNPDGTDS